MSKTGNTPNTNTTFEQQLPLAFTASNFGATSWLGTSDKKASGATVSSLSANKINITYWFDRNVTVYVYYLAFGR